MSGCSIAVLNLLTKSLISSVWCVKSNLLVWQVWINTKTKGEHNARKTAALVGSSEPPKKRRQQTKQRTINEILRQHQSQVDLEDGIDSDEETPWSAANCRINSLDNIVINWFSCESCNRWYHSVSIDLADKSESELSEMNYVCNKCNWNYDQNRIRTSLCEHFLWALFVSFCSYCFWNEEITFTLVSLSKNFFISKFCNSFSMCC